MNVVDELSRLLGSDAVAIDEEDLSSRARDHSASAFVTARAEVTVEPPVCVVRPGSAADVGRVLAWASATRVPVVPFGGGSGVCRGIRGERAIALDLARLSRIVALDGESRVVTAQAGVRGPDLQVFVHEHGFFLGHQPQSIDISTVGGWVATRACGQLSARYGGIEDLVAGLEAVLPDGRVVRSKVTPRRSTGPDVASLMVGSEGTLGVITEVTLRVSPVPGARADAAVSFENMADGIAVCRAIAQSNLSPTLVRLYDSDDAAIFFRHADDPPTGPILLLSFAGAGARARMEAAVERGGTGLGPRWTEYWWEHRNDAVADYPRVLSSEGILGPHAIVDTIEVAATWSSLRALYHSMKGALTDVADIVGCHLSHVYPDGACLYFTLASACEDDDRALAAHARWWEVGMETCLDAGGTISHHHGIGRLKARWLPRELEGWWDVLVAVKRALDPAGIMNPGALGL